MARRYLAVAVALLLLLPAASALKFEVQVSELSDHAVYGTEVDTDPLVASTTVENIGSIGCTYRLRADMSYGNTTESAYSRAAGLWPGDSELVSVKHLALNHTGEVDGNLSLEYCGESFRLDNFSYTVNNTVPEEQYTSRTVDSNSSAARVRIEGASTGTMVPVSAPGGWKVGHAEVEQGKATLDYEAPLFQREEEIEYAVLEDGEPSGTVRVSLEPRSTVLSTLSSNVWKLLLGISLVANAGLVLSRSRALKKHLNWI